MPQYTEDPFQRIVNVHWKKKDPPDPDAPIFGHPGGGTCGLFQLGILGGLAVGFSGRYVLVDYGLYMLQPSVDPYRRPDQPDFFFPMFLEYVAGGYAPGPYPFIWASPEYWLLTEMDAGRRIVEYRNYNPQLFSPANVGTDPSQEGPSITILRKQPNELYHPIFMVLRADGSRATYPNVLIQAKCKNTTWGGLPPTPAEWGLYSDNMFFLIQPNNPGYGSTNLPIKG